MPRIITNRAFIARWTRMPHSIGRSSASASSHPSLSLAAFITNTAESDFRYTQPAKPLRLQYRTRRAGDEGLVPQNGPPDRRIGQTSFPNPSAHAAPWLWLQVSQ